MRLSSAIVLVCSLTLAYFAVDPRLLWARVTDLFHPANATIPTAELPPVEPSSAEISSTANILPDIDVPETMNVARAVRKVFLAVEKSEGAGARVRRSIGVPQLRNFSPFLMLDHFSVGMGAGFPDHPHR